MQKIFEMCIKQGNIKINVKWIHTQKYTPGEATHMDKWA